MSKKNVLDEAVEKNRYIQKGNICQKITIS